VQEFRAVTQPDGSQRIERNPEYKRLQDLKMADFVGDEKG